MTTTNIFAKPGDIVKMRGIHFGYNVATRASDDKTTIWASISLPAANRYGGESFDLTGYIPNRFENEVANEIVADVKLLNIKFMEHANGGRSNHVKYDSIEAYLADPTVKELVKKKCTAGVFSFGPGDADRVDVNIDFTIIHPAFNGEILSLNSSLWDDIVPSEWYDEFYAPVVQRLEQLDVFENDHAAYADTQQCDDLFGQRFFPVIKAPRTLTNEMRNLAENCKNHSKIIGTPEHIYIGLRCKPSEVDVITDVYKAGGHIVKGVQWDW